MDSDLTRRASRVARHVIGGGLAASLALVLACPARSADTDGNFAIKGAGLKDCAAFLQALDAGSSDIALYGGWIEGYLTGINHYREDVFDATPWQSTETLIGLMQSVCGQLPGETRYMEAFHQLLRRLLPQALSESSEAELLRSGDRQLVIYRAILAVAQQRLQEVGYDPGATDGIFAGPTSEALTRYQEDNDLPQSGLPDQQTLFSLFFSPPAD